jgi:tRNA nucleotidyltransferase (CCA-adding enzyme)
VRFSAQLDFTIEEGTLQAIRNKAANLNWISAERIRVEMTKLLISDYPDRLRLLYEIGITEVILPEFDTMMKTEQKNIHHIYNVGDHTIHAVAEIAGSLKEHKFETRERTILRWTMLLHDVEKPNTVTIGKDGQNHFYGHQEKGAITAKNILRRLKFDNDTIDAVVHLIRWHDYRFILTPAGMRRAASKVGKEYMELLFEVNRADTSAKNPKLTKEKYERLASARQLYRNIVDNEECVNLKELKINGRDLIALGMKPGKRMGEILSELLSEVLDNPTLNDTNILLPMAKELMKEYKVL